MANRIVEIPGFYYDEERRRYFKIITKSISSSGSKYHRDEIERRAHKDFQDKERDRLRTLKHQHLREFGNHLRNISTRVFSDGEFYEFADGAKIRGPQLELIKGYQAAMMRNAGLHCYKKGSIWSNLNPSIGIQAQSAEGILVLPHDGAIIITTNLGNIFWVQSDGEVKSIYYEKSDNSIRYETLRMRLHFRRLFIQRKEMGTNIHSFMNVDLEAFDKCANSCVEGPYKMDFGDQDVFDSMSDGHKRFFVAKHGAIDVISPTTTSNCRIVAKIKLGRSSDVLSMKWNTHSANVSSDDPIAWFACRDGSIYELYRISGTRQYTFRLMYQFKSSSILTIEEVGKNFLLTSSPGESCQVLRLISKKVEKLHGRSSRQDPTIMYFKTTFRNLTQENEILVVTADGCNIIYGIKTVDGKVGDFEIFSTLRADNFVQEFDEKTGEASYHPINSMRNCFGNESSSLITSLVQVGICSSKDSSSDCSQFSVTGEPLLRKRRLIMLSLDEDTAGLTYRATDLI
ncbi:LAFE_0D04104g1_1 [Lachancea fermentati]|uniref:LAFE_0D04104g1_1 n=1 Tax=Lachancea fermentati TaxID=4955 RepID=A0A1G4MBG8_LACFM|nr:LAFE_0D04104g1_1 [Lachancea fermentati]